MSPGKGGDVFLLSVKQSILRNFFSHTHPRTCKWIVTHIYVMKWLFGRGPTTLSLEDLRSPWLLTPYESWDDPPSREPTSYNGIEPEQIMVDKLPTSTGAFTGFLDHQQYFSGVLEDDGG